MSENGYRIAMFILCTWKNVLAEIMHYQPPLPLCFIKKALVFINTLYFCPQRRDGFKRMKGGKVGLHVNYLSSHRPNYSWADQGTNRWWRQTRRFANLTVLSLNLCVINLCSHGTYYSKLDDGIVRHELSMKAAREKAFDLFIWS